jgi:LysR family transcriptional regulator, hydrogen peroxide-inducible genes activator
MRPQIHPLRSETEWGSRCIVPVSDRLSDGGIAKFDHIARRHGRFANARHAGINLKGSVYCGLLPAVQIHPRVRVIKVRGKLSQRLANPGVVKLAKFTPSMCGQVPRNNVSRHGILPAVLIVRLRELCTHLPICLIHNIDDFNRCRPWKEEELMTLSELRYLVAVDDLRHFGHAAERCHITQSTLSTQLRKLEDFLGITLFERASRPVTVTPIGQSIVIRARRIIEEADQICDLARHDKGLLSNTLKLGIIPTLSPYLLPLFLEDLHRAHPQLRLVLREDLTANLIDALAAYEVDVLLLALPDDLHGLHALPLFDEPFWFAFPATDPLRDRTVIDENDLVGRRLLLLAEGHCLRGQALAVCGQQVRKSDTAADVLRANSLETICAMVAAGLGCTLLPALAVPRLTAGGSGVQARAFKASGAIRRIGLLWRVAFPRSEDLMALGKFIQDRLPGDLRPRGEAEMVPIENLQPDSRSLPVEA